VLRPNALVNLYHWVFGEPHYMRNSIGVPLPIADLPYDTDEGLSAALRDRNAISLPLLGRPG
jgi:hypothetical protein